MKWKVGYYLWLGGDTDFNSDYVSVVRLKSIKGNKFWGHWKSVGTSDVADDSSQLKKDWEGWIQDGYTATKISKSQYKVLYGL